MVKQMRMSEKKEADEVKDWWEKEHKRTWMEGKEQVRRETR